MSPMRQLEKAERILSWEGEQQVTLREAGYPKDSCLGSLSRVYPKHSLFPFISQSFFFFFFFQRELVDALSYAIFVLDTCTSFRGKNFQEFSGFPFFLTVIKVKKKKNSRLHYQAATLPGVNILPVFRKLLQVQIRRPSVLFHKTALFH